MQYIDVNAATTDIAGNCGANQLSSNVILAALIWSSRHRQALPRRWLSARQAPHMNLQPCTNASSWSMMCPVTHRPSSARAPHCPCSANSGMQNRTSCPAGTSRTWVRIDAGAHVHDRYQQFWTVFGGAQCESQPTWLPELAALESNCKAIATLRWVWSCACAAARKQDALFFCLLIICWMEKQLYSSWKSTSLNPLACYYWLIYMNRVEMASRILTLNLMPPTYTDKTRAPGKIPWEFVNPK